MYVPPSFAEASRDRLFEAIEHWGFGLLVSAAGENRAPLVSHVPFALERRRDVLVTHLARANPQASTLAGGLERRVRAVFPGPHAYISPRWLDDPERNVPTWNYAAVQVGGTARMVTAPAAVATALADLTRRYEGTRGWCPDRMPIDLRERLQAAVTVIEIDIEELDGAWKMSQNKPAASRRRIARALRSQGTDDARAVAALIGGGTRSMFAAWLARVAGTLASWHRRARTRAELARLDARGCADIGISLDQAHIEAAKPFWRE